MLEEQGVVKLSTESAITSLLSLRFVFKLPLRAMEGLAKSLVSMMNLDMEVPDYSTLSIKLREMKMKLPSVRKDSGGGYVASRSKDSRTRRVESQKT
jgi:hypothetical protein